jgi:hypothetical protein
MRCALFAGKVLLLLSLVCIATTTFAQKVSDRKETKKWRFYTSPGKTFGVDLPYLPKIQTLSPTKDNPEPSFEDVEWLEFFNGEQRAKSISIYVPPAKEWPLVVFFPANGIAAAAADPPSAAKTSPQQIRVRIGRHRGRHYGWYRGRRVGRWNRLYTGGRRVGRYNNARSVQQVYWINGRRYTRWVRRY